MKKIAITLPVDQAEAIEEIRRRRRIPRSRVIQEAIAHFLEAQGPSSRVHKYEAGYRRVPEDAADARALAAAGAAVLPTEDWG
jgi:metal-responsive CopG/Arc/MetJ family transcriptional regulator